LILISKEGEHMENRAAYMTGLNTIEMRNVEIPVIKENEVLIKLEYIGICGSDVHYLENGRIGDFIVEGDFILGHECAGRVEAVGKAVTSLKRGDKVALEPGCTCGQCEFCKLGKYNLCPDVKFLATPPYQGCLTKYLAYPASMCFLLPENVSTKEGALVEPLAVGMHAIRQGRVGPGKSVMILGSGCIGLVTLFSGILHGAADITVADMIDKRLASAKKLGADQVINVKDEDILKRVEEITDGRGFDVIIETAGNEITIGQTPYLVKRGGCIVLVGLAAEDTIPFNFAKIMNKEVEIKSVFRYRNLYDASIRAVAKGMIDISSIVTHEFDFEDTANAFKYVINNKNDVVKAVIKL